MSSRERSSTYNGPGEVAPQSDSWSVFSEKPSLRSLRMRRSFFGRSNSDAGLSRRIPNSQSKTSGQEQSQEQIPPRPNTSLSIEPTRRKRTESLETIRNSIFGGRKNRERENSNTSNTSRPSSRSDQLQSATFKSEDDCKWSCRMEI